MAGTAVIVFVPVLPGSEGTHGALVEAIGPPFGLLVLPAALILLQRSRSAVPRRVAVGLIIGVLLSGVAAVVIMVAQGPGMVVLLALVVGLLVGVFLVRPAETKVLLAGSVLGLVATISLTALGIAVVDEHEFALMVPITGALVLLLWCYLRRVLRP